MSRVLRGLRITGRVIKLIFFAVVFSVIALLLWRIFSSSDPKSVSSLTPNEKLCAVYEESGKEMYMFRQEQKSITAAERNYGYFSVTECVFIPDANQVQIVFRYNNSTIRALAEDKGLESVPSREDELFDVSLVIATDLTPDNASDNATNAPESVQLYRAHPVQEKRDTKNMYNYYRYVFDLDEIGISLSELLREGELLAAYTDIYYNEEINYDEISYGTLCLYDYKSENIRVKLDRGDRKALESFGGE